MDRNQLIAKIKNAQRWTTLSDELKAPLSSAKTRGEFVKICNKIGVSDPLGLYQSREDFYTYGNIPIPKDPSSPTQDGGHGGGHFPMHGIHRNAGRLDGSPEVNYEEIKNGAKEYAEKSASEWNITRDPTKAMSFFHAYGMAEQEYWDSFAKNNPDKTREWADKHPDPNLTRAVKRLELIEDARKTGLPEPDFTWKPDEKSLSRKVNIAAQKTAKNPKGKKQYQEQLYRSDPRAFAEAVFGQKKSKYNPSGKNISDPNLREVINTESVNKTSSAIKKSSERRQARVSGEKRLGDNFPGLERMTDSSVPIINNPSNTSPSFPDTAPHSPSSSSVGPKRQGPPTPSLSTIKTVARVARLAFSPGKLVFASVFGIMLSTFIFVTVFAATEGGVIGPTTDTTVNPEPPVPVERPDLCDDSLPGLVYCVEAPTSVGNGESFRYKISGAFHSGQGPKPLEDYIMTLTIPGDLIRLSSLPGEYTPTRNDSTSETTYTWRLSENLSLFTQTEGSDPPVYYFSFETEATPLKENVTVSVEFLIR